MRGLHSTAALLAACLAAGCSHGLSNQQRWNDVAETAATLQCDPKSDKMWNAHHVDLVVIATPFEIVVSEGAPASILRGSTRLNVETVLFGRAPRAMTLDFALIDNGLTSPVGYAPVFRGRQIFYINRDSNGSLTVLFDARCDARV